MTISETGLDNKIQKKAPRKSVIISIPRKCYDNVYLPQSTLGNCVHEGF